MPNPPGPWATDQATAPVPTAEGSTPDGEDDDCDGYTDEGVTGCVQSIQVDTGPSEFQIFAYEAARWDATTIDEGEGSSVPCSQAGKLPWTMTSEDEADAIGVALGAVVTKRRQAREGAQLKLGLAPGRP